MLARATNLTLRPMNFLITRDSSYPKWVPGRVGRFQTTIVFILISVGILILAAFAVDRIAHRVGEKAAVNAGAEITSQQSELIGGMFSRVISNLGALAGPLDTASVTDSYQSGQMDSTTAVILLMAAGDLDELLTTNNVRHISMHTVDGMDIWTAGDTLAIPHYGDSLRVIEENRTVSNLRHRVRRDLADGSGDQIVRDVIQSFVPIQIDALGETLLLDLVLDVTDTLRSGISDTKSGIRTDTLLLLAGMSLVVFTGELRMSRKNAVLVAREHLVSDRLDNENRELQRIDRAQNEFLSSVSHELKTPLAALMGFTRVLKKNDRKNLNKEDLSSLQIIERNGWLLNELIDDLLNLKEDSQTSGIPVIIASAQTGNKVLRTVRDLGASDYLAKPWQNGELAWRVEKAIKSSTA